MDGNFEVIALVLGESSDRRWHAGQFGKGAQRLVRRDGRVTLEPVESQEEFEREARTTGCFRRGKPIRDPATQEVIGYEMEQVPLLRRGGKRTRRTALVAVAELANVRNDAIFQPDDAHELVRAEIVGPILYPYVLDKARHERAELEKRRASHEMALHACRLAAKLEDLGDYVASGNDPCAAAHCMSRDAGRQRTCQDRRT